MRLWAVAVLVAGSGCLSLSSDFPEVGGDGSGGDSVAGDPAMGDTNGGDPAMGDPQGDPSSPVGDSGPPPICDGTALSASCFAPGECPSMACMSDGNECTVLACEGPDTNERFACADQEDANNWNMPGLPCLAVSCVSETVQSGDNAIGADCYGSNTTVSVAYSFRTQATGMFNIFMRNVVDADWDADAFYSCSITNTSSGTVNFEFREAALNDGDHGPGCAGLMTQDNYCWMHADADSSDADIDRFTLNSGNHSLDCSITLDATDEYGGFDGIIVVNNIGFRPDEPTMGDCSNSDQVFTSGSCTSVNWGPNLSRMTGLCNRSSFLADGVSCSSAGGNTCCNGTCINSGVPGTCP